MIHLSRNLIVVGLQFVYISIEESLLRFSAQFNETQENLKPFAKINTVQ